MQRARDQLLAGARFAGDEHRHRRARQTTDGAEHLLHRRRLAEQLGRTAVIARARRGALHALRRASHEIDDLVDVEGLRQVLEGAALVGGDRVAEVGVGGHHDDRQLRPRRVDAAQQIETGLPRHPDIGEQHIGRIAAQRLERRLGGLEDARQHAAALQRALEHPTDRGVVIDQPDAQRPRAHGTDSVADGAAPSGSSRLNTVRPGSLSNSMLPPLRVTISCATARPSPVPLARPVTSG